MGHEELAANLFRATQTEAKLRRDHVKGKENANQTHYDVGKRFARRSQILGVLCLRIFLHRRKVSSSWNVNSRKSYLPEIHNILSLCLKCLERMVIVGICNK